MVGADVSGSASGVQSNLDSHTEDTVSHVTASEKIAWNGKQDALTFDSSPASGSTNPVTSGGIYTTINNKLNRTTDVNKADTNYSTLMARGMSLHSSDATPAVNGAICWTYE